MKSQLLLLLQAVTICHKSINVTTGIMAVKGSSLYSLIARCTINTSAGFLSQAETTHRFWGISLLCSLNIMIMVMMLSRFSMIIRKSS
jgi:hypothetical protein